jgi:hypothetical protein
VVLPTIKLGRSTGGRGRRWQPWEVFSSLVLLHCKIQFSAEAGLRKAMPLGKMKMAPESWGAVKFFFAASCLL